MGITGLYAELGAGERVAFAKYASDFSESNGRRLRIAIDASIWSFQVQASKGGVNPALRTLYYRLIRLLGLNVTPLFVFDGPGRPAFKRNHKTHADFTPAQTRLTKKLLKHFGFPHITAPGEAEAECAALQNAGIVDAVMSEDVDTIMFGSGVTIRKWSAEGPRNKTPTHITVYDRECIAMEAGLKPSGMVLIALMRGGDYLPTGIPGCGIKIAVEAAKAGFGEDLCRLANGDEEGFIEWRDRLQYELVTNKSKYFGRRHKAIKIPVDFPNKEVLGYYVEPLVSPREKLERLRIAIEWDNNLDIVALRELTRDAFEWRGTVGAFKFVRTLAPALVAHGLYTGERRAVDVVDRIHGRREHFTTDECQELRVSYIPVAIVPIDVALEEQDEQEDAAEQAGVLEDEAEAGVESKRKGEEYSPYEAERIWVLECFVRKGLPKIVEEWEQGKTKMKKTTTKATIGKKKTTIATEPTDTGVITQYFPVSKPRPLSQSQDKGNTIARRKTKLSQKHTEDQADNQDTLCREISSCAGPVLFPFQSQSEGNAAVPTLNDLIRTNIQSQSSTSPGMLFMCQTRSTISPAVKPSSDSLRRSSRPSTPLPTSPTSSTSTSPYLPTFYSAPSSPLIYMEKLVQTVDLSSSPESAHHQKPYIPLPAHSPERQKTPDSRKSIQESPGTAAFVRQVELICLDSSSDEMESPSTNRRLDFAAHESPHVNTRRRTPRRAERVPAQSPLQDLQLNVTVNLSVTVNNSVAPGGNLREHDRFPSPLAKKASKLRVALRDSIPGAWKVLQDGTRPLECQGAWEDVEVIDLTGT